MKPVDVVVGLPSCSFTQNRQVSTKANPVKEKQKGVGSVPMSLVSSPQPSRLYGKPLYFIIQKRSFHCRTVPDMGFLETMNNEFRGNFFKDAFPKKCGRQSVVTDLASSSYHIIQNSNLLFSVPLAQVLE